jgi:hypothetical protein
MDRRHVANVVNALWTDPLWSTLLLERKDGKIRDLLMLRPQEESALNPRRRTSEQTTNR